MSCDNNCDVRPEHHGCDDPGLHGRSGVCQTDAGQKSYKHPVLLEGGNGVDTRRTVVHNFQGGRYAKIVHNWNYR